jgi:hypothetical protein
MLFKLSNQIIYGTRRDPICEAVLEHRSGCPCEVKMGRETSVIHRYWRTMFISATS